MNALAHGLGLALGVANHGMFPTVSMTGMAGLGDGFVEGDTPEIPITSGSGEVTTGINLSTDIGSGTTPDTGSGGGGPSLGTQLSQIFNSLTAGAVAGSAIYKNTQTPSVVPGSNLVWNPATGQFVNASGTTLTSPLGNLTTGGGGTMLLVLGGALLLVLAMGGRH